MKADGLIGCATLMELSRMVKERMDRAYERYHTRDVVDTIRRGWYRPRRCFLSIMGGSCLFAFCSLC